MNLDSISDYLLPLGLLVLYFLTSSKGKKRKKPPMPQSVFRSTPPPRVTPAPLPRVPQEPLVQREEKILEVMEGPKRVRRPSRARRMLLSGQPGQSEVRRAMLFKEILSPLEPRE